MIKKTLYLLTLLIFMAACGGSKKVVETTPKKDVQVATKDSVVIVQEAHKDSSQTITVKDPDIKVMDTIDSKKIEVIEAFNHSIWNSLLKENVSNKGNVNYEGFRQQKQAIREYITSLGAQMPEESWSLEDQLAYWMNAYNAMTVDLILRNLPLKSIKDIDKPWNQRLWKLGSKWYNLDEIEHQILRKMNDPRIHFGINCASFSCPPLLNEAFTAQKVDEQLDALAKQFVNDPLRNTITSDRIQISKIFSWFAKDFKKEGSLIDFLNKYSETPINSNARKSFKDYDWALNQ